MTIQTSQGPTIADGISIVEPPSGLSVIVPFAPGETEGAVLLRQLRARLVGAEIVLACVNGHPPRVDTRVVTEDAAFRICASAPGRACQMNAAARTASGRWLWFLHADSRLSSRTVTALRHFLEEDVDALGYFDLRYRGDGPTLARLNACMANLRAHWLSMPFGDQGLVLPAAWFERLGGYDEHAPRGEDHLLVWRARQAGLPLHRLGAPLSSSARSYGERGWCRATAGNLCLTVRQAWPQWLALRRTRSKRAAKP